MIALAMSALGCGYRTGYTVRSDVSVLAVPVFANDTFYRNVEIDLTSAVVAEIEKITPYRIGDSASADAVLQGRITSYRTPVLQEDAANAVTASQVVLAVKVVLVDASGRTLYSGSVREAESFSPAAGETELAARGRLLRRVARRIVETALEEDW